MRLVDLKPAWINTDDGRTGVGIRFDNPRGRGKVRLLFNNPLDGGAPLANDESLPANNGGERWTRHGSDFASLSITPSIDEGPGGWHGFVTDGHIT